MIDRRTLLTTAALLPLATARLGGAQVGAARTLTPEQFGAKGDGTTDDSAAFELLSDAINVAGGGTITLRRTTYVVGSDGLVPARLLDLVGLTRPLRIEGNGARLRCRAGARYGSIQPRGETRVERKRATKLRPYTAMISVQRCSGSVEITDVELDGNAAALEVLNKHGDHGWQIGCGGLVLRDNSGPEAIRRVNAHHQAQDGIYIDGLDADTPGASRELVEVRCHDNGRQGTSIVGGRGYRFTRCHFERSARGQIITSPGAGVDIEAQRGKRVRRLTFTDCRFSDNRGVAVVADSGDSADASFTRCTFIGTTSHALWPNKPGMVFTNCTIVGTLVHAFADPDRRRAARFIGCLFTNDPKLSPTGKVALRKNLIADLPRGAGVSFIRCRFTLVGDGVLPWSSGVTYTDCLMSQRSSHRAITRGTFRGTNRISGPALPGKSIIEGTLIINGRAVPRTETR